MCGIAANPAHRGAAMAQGKTVLIVDDEPNMRGFLRMALEDEGYTVRTATNGQEALDRVRRTPPDAILLDLMMPVMDGWSFLTARRTLSSEYRCPVIVMSAVGGWNLARELGAASFLAKPFDIYVLLATLAGVLEP